MASMKGIHTKCDEFGIFLGADSAPETWSGHLENEDAISEEQIVEYVKYGNPKLFDKLHGMPVKSTDVPRSCYGHRALRKASEVVDTIRAKIPDLLSCDRIFRPTPLEPNTVDTNSRVQDNAGLRQRIQERLADGETFALKRLPTNSASLDCHSAQCVYNGGIQAHMLYLELDHDLLGGAIAAEKQAPLLFHLVCLNKVYDTHQRRYSYGAADLSMSLDGVDHETVIQAANHLCRSKTSVNQDDSLSNKPGCAWRYPYNSGEAHKFHSQKNNEIDDILDEVVRVENNNINTQHGSRSTSPDLILTPPPHMERFVERYKKQGLSAWDLTVSNRERAEHRKLLAASEAIDHERALKNSLSLRHCYCFEPDDGESDMIRCSSNWCTIGWFHLRCTKLPRLPVIGEKFYCEYCRDDFGPFMPVVTNPRDAEVASPSTTTVTDESESDHDQIMADGDWDDGEEDSGTDVEGAGDPNVVIPSIGTGWGTPINSPEGQRLEVERLIRRPSSPTRAHKRHRQC